MSLRRRLALILSSIVASVFVLTMVINYVLAGSTLRASVDTQLQEQADAIRTGNGNVLRAVLNQVDNQRGNDDNARGEGSDSGSRTAGRPPRGRALAAEDFRDRIGGFQFVATDGSVTGTDIPVDAAIISRVRETNRSEFSDQRDADGNRVRVLTLTAGDRVAEGTVIQLADDISSLDNGLRTLGRGLLFTGVIGTLFAGLVGWIVAGRFTQPITAVTAAASQVARQQDLPNRIDVDRDDEVGQLATSFNAMITALEVSRDQQTRLVADASHELRTPLTSLRMKIDFLKSQPDLPDARRLPIVAGAAMELEELTDLVAELVDLASHSTSEEAIEPVNLGELISDVATRFETTTGRTIDVTSSGTVVPVRPRMIRRAVTNLIDNALKYSPDGAVNITETSGRIEVRDHGPGIAEADQARAFDRFFRADGARTQPGSGIGLAIVKRAADVHGGEVWISSPTDGGTIVGLSLPTGAIARN